MKILRVKKSRAIGSRFEDFFLKFWKPIWLSIPRGVWPYNFLQEILTLRGLNNENITREKIAKIRIAIWGLRSARIKKMKKTDPNFFQKKMGVCFLQLFDPSIPKASNRDPTPRDYFTRKFLKIWAQICDKIFRINKNFTLAPNLSLTWVF